ncbi:MAG: hypothetical protein JRJ11_12140 [Deltaproteobacteria bacterium]|nr:hypothetical protein [Deltaproteobacteria bacterium]MBW1910274.1 hypothetical protein [Deltaproteobacteria bacterium]MBW2035334.1 hypothetical protein [Deltaproteobacteria bacterium]MBW2357934.1 hypothetical protein [Deltaproteobacteria bacterium]
MKKVDTNFGLKLDNIGVLNLRNEFNTYYNNFMQNEFRAQFTGPYREIRTPYLTWYGISDSLLTFILQRSILGIEAYIVAAVYFNLGSKSQLNDSAIKHLRNPFSLKGKGTADIFYNKLPSLVSDELCLQAYDGDLWATTKTFYTEVRNPIFHGYEIKSESIDNVPVLYRFLDRIYEWIDSWFDMEEIIPGTGVLANSGDRGRS